MPKHRTLTYRETHAALMNLTSKSVQVITDDLNPKDSLNCSKCGHVVLQARPGSVDTAWRVVEHVVGKPKQVTEVDGQVDHVFQLPQEMKAWSLAMLKAGMRVMLQDASEATQAEYKVLASPEEEPSPDGKDDKRGM